MKKTKDSFDRQPGMGPLPVTRNGNLTFVGLQSRGGTYVLRMVVLRQLTLAFGRFRAGKLITVPPGEYLYVGSALSLKGATCLARRLTRHATRTGNKARHAIRDLMARAFLAVGLCDDSPLPKDGKHLRWNVDHLLDRREVELVGALVIRSPRRIEGTLGLLLESDPHTSVIARGLGANDIRGNTHLLRVQAGDEWWEALPDRVIAMMRMELGH